MTGRRETCDFAWAAKVLMAIADETASRRLLPALEGGYDVAGLSESAAARVSELMRI